MTVAYFRTKFRKKQCAIDMFEHNNGGCAARKHVKSNVKMYMYNLTMDTKTLV